MKLLAIGFFAYGIFCLWSSIGSVFKIRFLLHYGYQARGKVVTRNEARGEGGYPYYRYDIEYFIANGERCIKQSVILNHDAPIGSRVMILYDPMKPKRSLIRNEYHFLWGSASLLWGLGTFVLAIWILQVVFAHNADWWFSLPSGEALWSGS